MHHDDWRRSIEPLRAWMDAGALYLWRDRKAQDWRAMANPAKDFDRDIREVVHMVCGRAPSAVRYLERPPNREHIINERRIRAHRERLRRDEDRRAKTLREYTREECRALEANPPDLRMCRSLEEMLVKVHAIACDRAKRRLDRESSVSGQAARRRGEPPVDPPPCNNGPLCGQW